jgi:hypothetical protein
MSTISKLAVLGLASIGAAIALAGTTTSASAEDIRGRCDGTVIIAAAYQSGAADTENHTFGLGDRDRVVIQLSAFGNLRWFCQTATAGLIENTENCGAAGRTAIDVRFRNDGGVRITCA